MLTSNEIMKSLGFDLESETETTKSYVKKAKLTGVEVCVFMRERPTPYYFWQRKRGLLKDTTKYDIIDTKMYQAQVLIRKEKNWGKMNDVDVDEETNKQTKEIKAYLNYVWEQIG